MTLSLALIYFGGVLAQTTLRALTGQGSSVAIVASTLAIGALFNPLRWRIQEFIDRRFYRRNYYAARTLGAFSSKLPEKTDLNRLGGELVSMVSVTMQPEYASLWLGPPGRRERYESEVENV